MTPYLQYFKGDRFAQHAGIDLLECSPGYAKCKVEIQEYHLNGAGVVHGAVLFTLADLSCAAATNTYGQVALSIENHISYFQKSTSGIIYATAKIKSKSNKLITCTVDIIDSEGLLLSNFIGTAYITKEKIDF
jgi:acyl-CoA thioesterase